ncbi:helix-turn-helix domain-containing protein [Mucilaginibacter jinjuensis]|uniref:AraC family transcriptional regulator n=1 Tax=Mucilaginibacter jinjuensis TaxID=1176721 RepID=A0ABY7TDB2_9SPHI|nr:AraC family transcriptional regulator [Mucilaginibacter jinjuensis]WCT14321.1 AraC family transcriptional regulator [Mucilaginibacter jinjuensis]
MRTIKIPGDFGDYVSAHNKLQLEGTLVVESCNQPYAEKLNVYIEEHLLLCVLEGEHHIRVGETDLVFGRQEMILFKKDTYCESHQVVNAPDGTSLNSVLFFISDKLITDFLRQTSFVVDRNPTSSEAGVTRQSFGNRMVKYLESLQPFFAEREPISPALLKLKLFELLHHLAEAHPLTLQAMVYNRGKYIHDISRIVSDNYLKKLPLQQLAYMSGRSLSSFRRDFLKIYELQPARWIQNQRLEKARELLRNTPIPVGDIYQEVGFESFGHFSRAYKHYFGHTPSAERAQLQTDTDRQIL